MWIPAFFTQICEFCLHLVATEVAEIVVRNDEVAFYSKKKMLVVIFIVMTTVQKDQVRYKVRLDLGIEEGIEVDQESGCYKVRKFYSISQ